MSGRPVDWSAVGWDRDPTPGDPDAVAELAARFRRTAEAVRTASEGLRNIRDADSYKGEAGEELRSRTRDLADAVEAVHQRYADAAEALDAYHPQQYAAQQMADQALRNAEAAQSQQVSASSALALYPEPLAGVPEDPQVTAYRSSVQRAGQEAAAAVAAARADVQRAHDYQDQAGRIAAGRLKDVIAHDRLSDSWRDDVVGNTVGRLSTGFLKTVAKWADRIAAVAGVIALVANVIPVVGQVVAVIAGAVAGLAGLVSLVANIILFARGEVGWTGLAFAAIGVVTGGLSRVARSAGKLAVGKAQARVYRSVMAKNHMSRDKLRPFARSISGSTWKTLKPLEEAVDSRGLLRGAVRDSAGTVWKQLKAVRAPREFARLAKAPDGGDYAWLDTFTTAPVAGHVKRAAENQKVIEAVARARAAQHLDTTLDGINRLQAVEGTRRTGAEWIKEVRSPDEEIGLPPQEIDAARTPEEDLEGARNGALFAIGYREHEIRRPVQGWPVLAPVPMPALRRDPVPS